MRMRRLTAMMAGAVAATLALPLAAADAPTLAVLRGLELGQWQLREIGPRGGERSICLGDMETLIQLQHPRGGCSRYVIDDRTAHGTIHYTCPGSGYGRTTIDLVTPRSVRIETQGVASGAPFHLELNARRMGACTGN
ncbi:hypothetical protein [Sphingomonas sp. CCH18-H6]|uniref:hypothetical protein n=1 Tax=Sphingomonas sp. CCH18-H6 TaxID=1768787 RepID=UPI000A4647B4